jgi:hypothetical protein
VISDVEAVVRSAKQLAATFDAHQLDGLSAKVVVDLAAQLERSAVAIKLLAMRRVDETGTWVTGNKSPEQWLARVTGTTIGEAAGVVTTARRLETLPQASDALRAGKLSPRQAALVAEGASLRPDAEADLVATAKSASLTKLRDEVTQIKVAAVDPAVHDKVHAIRSHRSWTDQHGAYRYEGTLTTVNGAGFDQVFGAFFDKVMRDNRAAGITDSRDQMAADAVMRMVHAAATGEGADAATCTKSRLHGVLVLDAHAYVRDALEPGERCELVGVGPIDLATAKAMLGDAIIDIAISNGQDVVAMAHPGRHPKMMQWLALYAQGAICSVTGCGRRDNLQADHSPEYEQSARTSVEDLRLKCRGCHYKKTHLHHRDGPRQPDGTYLLLAPDDPDP